MGHTIQTVNYIYVDNQSAGAMAQNDGYYGRAKYVDIRHPNMGTYEGWRRKANIHYNQSPTGKLFDEADCEYAILNLIPKSRLEIST